MRDNKMKYWLMLTLVGKDRSGIIAKISHAFIRHAKKSGRDIVDSPW